MRRKRQVLGLEELPLILDILEYYSFICLLIAAVDAIGRDRRIPEIANCSPNANARAYVGLIHFVIYIMSEKIT